MASSRRTGSLLLWALLTSACQQPAAVALDETSAAEVIGALADGHIAATRQADPDSPKQYRVMVDSLELSRAATLLARQALPKRPGPGTLELLPDDALVPSRVVEQARLVAGLSGDLERTLQAIDGIVSARVHIALAPPSKSLLGPPSPAPKAVVVVTKNAAAAITTSEIQSLVSQGVSGLSPEAVRVISHLHRPRPAPTPTTSRPSLKWIALAAIAANLLQLLVWLGIWIRFRRRPHNSPQLHKA